MYVINIMYNNIWQKCMLHIQISQIRMSIRSNTNHYCYALSVIGLSLGIPHLKLYTRIIILQFILPQVQRHVLYCTKLHYHMAL